MGEGQWGRDGEALIIASMYINMQTVFVRETDF